MENASPENEEKEGPGVVEWPFDVRVTLCSA